MIKTLEIIGGILFILVIVFYWWASKPVKCFFCGEIKCGCGRYDEYPKYDGFMKK